MDKEERERDKKTRPFDENSIVLSIHERENELCTCNEVRAVRATDTAKQTSNREERGRWKTMMEVSCHKGGQRRIWRTSALLFLRNGGGRFEAAEAD